MGIGNKRRTERNRTNAENKPEWVHRETMNRKGNPDRNRKEKKSSEQTRKKKIGGQKIIVGYRAVESWTKKF